MGSEAHRIDAVKPEVGLADGLGGVHVQATAGVRLDDSGNLPDGLDRAKLTVHSADGDQDRIVAHQLPQLVQVYPACKADSDAPTEECSSWVEMMCLPMCRDAWAMPLRARLFASLAPEV